MLGAISYDPIVHIDLGPLSISPHGIGIAVGFLLGARLMLPAAKARGISEDDVYAVLTRAAIGAIIGARLAYVINHFSDYDSILDIFKVWEGGISLLGGFFGAILLAMPEMRKRGMDFWQAMDAAAPGMALGVIIGRIGDLIVGDHLGTRTDFFLGFKCTGADTASPCEAPIGALVHQTALYDLLFTTVLLFALLRLRRTPRFDGFLIIVFGAWYGTQRIIEDFLREDVRRLGLTGSQFTSLATVLVCLTWLAFVRRSPKWGHWSASGPGGLADGDEGPGAADEPNDVDGAPGGPVLPEGSGLPPTMASPSEPEGAGSREE